MAGMLLSTLMLSVAALALTCEDYEASVIIASIEGSAINEASGLARARTRSGVWFTHNDAGGLAELYSFTLEGEFLDTHAVEGAEFRDWEDLSAGPCPDGGHCFYIGDIGDNGRSRETVTVYAVAEPGAGEAATVVATWHAMYPSGAQDSETLFVHPRTGRIYLATKNNDDSGSIIYRFAEQPGDHPLYLEEVHSWALEDGNLTTTGGDWDLDGDRLAIRTYNMVWEWDTDPCDPDAHWDQEPSGWPVKGSGGEAIAYSLDGDLLAVTEGSEMDITRLRCVEPGSGSGDCDSGDPDSDADSDADVDADTDTDTDADADADADVDSDTDTDSGPGADTGDGEGDDGCACGGGCGSAGAPALLLALLAAGGLWLRTRRRDSPGRSPRL